MSYIYTGPSWAASSFPMEQDGSTNLAKQWNFPYVDASSCGTSVLNRVGYVRSLDLRQPIVWIYNEPIGDLEKITGMSHAEFLTRKDWVDIWNECNQHCLKAIASLQVPILLIGAHSDIVDCDYSNIKVGCHSWQKYLAQQAGMTVDNGIVDVELDDGSKFTVDRCWGAEIMHKFMHEHPEIDPDPSLVDSIWDIFFFWQQLERCDLFFEVHPNVKGTTKFAQFMLPVVEKFIKESQ